MKRSPFALIVLLTLATFVGCKSENDESEEDLVNTWVAVNFNKEECNNESFNGSRNLECTDRTCTLLKLQSEGRFERIVTENFVSISQTGNWSVNGTKLKFSYSEEGDEFQEVYEYILEGGVLSTILRVEANNCLETTTWEPFEEPESE